MRTMSRVPSCLRNQTLQQKSLQCSHFAPLANNLTFANYCLDRFPTYLQNRLQFSLGRAGGPFLSNPIQGINMHLCARSHRVTVTQKAPLQWPKHKVAAPNTLMECLSIS